MPMSIPHPRLLAALLVLLLLAGALPVVIAGGGSDAEGGTVTELPGAPPPPTVSAADEARVRAALNDSATLAELLSGVPFEVRFIAHATHVGSNAFSAILAWSDPRDLTANWKVERCSGSRILEFVDPLAFVDVTRLAVTVDVESGALVVMGVIAPIPDVGESFDDLVNPRQVSDASQARVALHDTRTDDVLASGQLGKLPAAYRNCPPGLEDD